LLKNRNFAQKSKLCSKIELFFKNRNFAQKFVLEIILNVPFCSLPDRLAVYRAIVDALLDSVIIRNFIENSDDGDEQCRTCREYGGLIVLCDNCSAPYHTQCAGLEDQVLGRVEKFRIFFKDFHKNCQIFEIFLLGKLI